MRCRLCQCLMGVCVLSLVLALDQGRVHKRTASNTLYNLIRTTTMKNALTCFAITEPVLLLPGHCCALRERCAFRCRLHRSRHRSWTRATRCRVLLRERVRPDGVL